MTTFATEQPWSVYSLPSPLRFRNTTVVRGPSEGSVDVGESTSGLSAVWHVRRARADELEGQC